MHEGFCNFNAGTLGTSMVEGRISAGVVVGDDSDVGGGASILGTLSGGGTESISIGERCLLGANSGIGISLGDDCVVEAGLYVTAATPVSTPDGVVKARELSGISGVMFIRDGQSGQVIARPRSAPGASSTPHCTPTTDTPTRRRAARELPLGALGPRSAGGCHCAPRSGVRDSSGPAGRIQGYLLSDVDRIREVRCLDDLPQGWHATVDGRMDCGAR